jgi:hypothetical protein
MVGVLGRLVFLATNRIAITIRLKNAIPPNARNQPHGDLDLGGAYGG